MNDLKINSVLFSGCSHVVGVGLNQEKVDTGHFANIMLHNIFGDQYQLENISVAGYSNERIFLDTLHKLMHNQFDYIFAGWTSIYRYTFCPEFNLMPTKQFTFCPTNVFHTLVKAGPIKKLAALNDGFLLLNHPHYSLCDIVKYTNILSKIAELKGTKIFFINNFLPWDNKFFNHIEADVTPTILTTYTNELLDSSNIDDIAVNALYHKMHAKYKEYGGINETLWLNLYQSFSNISCDVGSDGMHPGYRSHQIFAELLTNEFNKKIKTVDQRH